MPRFPLVDSHVHLWSPGRLRYAWLAGVPLLNRDHLADDFRRDCGAVAVAKMVFVQCECDPMQSFEEAAWVADLAREEPRLRGIVAQAPLEQGEAVERELGRLREIPLVRGIRRLLQSETDDAFCLRPEFVRGVRLLSRHGYTFDLCILHRQLANTIRLVRQCPDVLFVLDHAGKPAIQDRRTEPWRAELKELSQEPNVVCKLSGLVTEADHARWTPADLRLYIDHVVECFGFDRILFGGDWPVSTQATDYPRWVATVDDALRGCSEDELQRVYVRNAERVYRI